MFSLFSLFLFYYFLVPVPLRHPVAAIAWLAMGTGRRLRELREPSLDEGSEVPRHWGKALLLFVFVVPLACPTKAHRSRKYIVSRVTKAPVFCSEDKKEGSVGADSSLVMTEKEDLGK